MNDFSCLKIPTFTLLLAGLAACESPTGTGSAGAIPANAASPNLLVRRDLMAEMVTGYVVTNNMLTKRMLQKQVTTDPPKEAWLPPKTVVIDGISLKIWAAPAASRQSWGVRVRVHVEATDKEQYVFLGTQSGLRITGTIHTAIRNAKNKVVPIDVDFTDPRPLLVHGQVASSSSPVELRGYYPFVEDNLPVSDTPALSFGEELDLVVSTQLATIPHTAKKKASFFKTLAKNVPESIELCKLHLSVQDDGTPVLEYVTEQPETHPTTPPADSSGTKPGTVPKTLPPVSSNSARLTLTLIVGVLETKEHCGVSKHQHRSCWVRISPYFEIEGSVQY
jgi:hypothetical protein